MTLAAMVHHKFCQNTKLLMLFHVTLLLIVSLFVLVNSSYQTHNTQADEENSFDGENEAQIDDHFIENSKDSESDSDKSEWSSRVPECLDEAPAQDCARIVQDGECNLDRMALQCRQSCNLCTKSMDSMSDDERSEKCKDLIPQCDVYANPIICCAMKPMANVTCQEACQFCRNIPFPQIPGTGGFMPGGGGGGSSGSGQNPVVYSDPCDPSKPPSASGGPQVPPGLPPPPGGGGGGTNGIPNYGGGR